MKRRGSVLGLFVTALTFLLLTHSSVLAQTPAGDPSWAPELRLPDDATVEWCVGDSVCFEVSAVDPDGSDSLQLSLLRGPIEYTTQTFGYQFTTDVCWTPTEGGAYTFVWRLVDRQMHTITDSVTFTLEPGQAPVIDDQSFAAESCDLNEPRELALAYTGTNVSFELLSGPGSIDPQTGVITYEPDTSGIFVFVVAASSNCGDDTATITDHLVLNLPPYCIGFDTTIYLCDREQVCYDVVARDPEGDEILITMPEGVGTFNQTSDTSGTVCFMPADVETAHYKFIFRAADSCVLETSAAQAEPYCCYDTVNVIVIITPPGELTCAADTTLDLCVPPGQLPMQICIPGFSSTWETTESDLGTFVDGSLCFQADSLGVYTATVVGSDSCGHQESCSTTITLKGNNAPYVTMAEDFQTDLCSPEEICFSAAADDVDFDIENVTVNYGTYDNVAGRICFSADTAGTYIITMTVTDECGAIDEGTTVVTVHMSQPPTVDVGPDREFNLCQSEEICLDAAVTGEDIQFFSTSTGASYDPGTGKLCFTPTESGTYTLFLQAHDACERVVGDTALVTVTVGHYPVVSGLSDTTIYMCKPTQICWPVSVTDADDDITGTTLNRGTYSDGSVCFVPYSAGTYQIILTATDACDHVVADTATVTVHTDQELQLVFPTDSTVFLCEPDTLCFPVGGIPDGATVEVTGIATYWNAATQSVCFFSDCCLENTVGVYVTTACGTYGQKFKVSVQTDSRPLVALGKDTTIFQCTPTSVCLPVGISDIDGNVESITVDGGTYDAYRHIVCFTPEVAGVHTVTVTATDSCGLSHSDQLNATIVFNEAPQVVSNLADSVFRVCDVETVDIPFTVTDADNNITDVTVIPSGTIEYSVNEPGRRVGVVHFMPTHFGFSDILITAVDGCEASSNETIGFSVIQPDPVTVTSPETANQVTCGPGTLCFDATITGDYTSVTTSLGTWADGQVCIDYNGELWTDVMIIAQGECEADTSYTHITVEGVESPTISCPTDVTVSLCAADTLSYGVGFRGGHPDDQLTVNAPNWVVWEDWNLATVYVPILEAGQHTVELIHAAPPCEPATCSFTVTAEMNHAPSLTIEGASFDVCTLGNIDLPFTYSDPDGDDVEITTSEGGVNYSGGSGTLTFVPTEYGSHVVTVTATDPCGLTDSHDITITFNRIPDIVIDCPDLLTPLSYCEPGHYCYDLAIAGDPFSVTSSFGTWADGQLCFDLTERGQYTAVVIAQGLCNADTCSIPIQLLNPTTITCGGDTTLWMCEFTPTTVEVPVSITGDNPTVIVTPPAATYADGIVTVPYDQPGPYEVLVQALNDCGTASCSFVVNSIINTPPAAQIVGDDIHATLCELQEYCFDYSVSDPDDNIEEIRTSLGVVNGSRICFTPEAFGSYNIILTATDLCGAVGADTVNLTIDQGTTVAMTCPDPVINVAVEIPGNARVAVPIDEPTAVVTVSPDGTYDYETQEVVVPIPTEGNFPVKVIATADCNADTCSFVLQAGQYQPPYVECVGETDTVLCLTEPRTVCLPVTALGSNIRTAVTGPAVLDDNLLCFTVNEPGRYDAVVSVWNDNDSVACVSSLIVTGGNPPVLEMPETLSYELCEPGQVCFDITLEDAEFDIYSIDLNYGTYDPLEQQICFQADTIGIYEISLTAADSCGNVAERTTAVTVGINEAPVVTLDPPAGSFMCQLAEVCVPVAVSEPGTVITTTLGQYDAQRGAVCFTPETAGLYQMTVTATDECGAFGTASTELDIKANHAPEITGLADTSVYICKPQEICLPAEVLDLDDNLTTVTPSRGTYSDGQLCFVPYSMGTYQVTLTATDECGAVTVKTATVKVQTDQDIHLVCPDDTTVFLCEPTTLCFPIGGVPAGATVTANGIATYWDAQQQELCFFSDCCLENRVGVTVTTACGSYSCSFNVSVQTNSRPLVLFPKDTTVMQCEFAQITIPVGINDIDGNIRSVEVDGGTYDAYRHRVDLTPTAEGDHLVTVTVTDSCGAVGRDEIHVNVKRNQAPIIAYTAIDTVYRQCTPEEICVPVGVSDPDGNIAHIIAYGGRYDAVNQSLCITPTGYGTFCATLTVTDSCGMDAQQQVCVDVAQGAYVEIQCNEHPDPGQDLCEPSTVCFPVPISGDDFTVTTSYGTWENGQLCFLADTTGTYEAKIIASSQCNADTCMVTVPIKVLEPLSITCPDNDTQFLCGPTTLCYDFTFTPSTAEVTVNAPAYLSGSQVCVPITEAGKKTVTLTVSNHCGQQQCSFDVSTTFNAAPVASLGADINLTKCVLEEVCVPLSVTDPDNNIASVTTDVGEVRDDNTTVCFTPTAYGQTRMIVTATDVCGLFDIDTVLINYDEGSHAAIQCPDGTQYASLCGPDSVCILAPVTPSNATVTVSPNGRYKPQTGEVCVYMAEGGAHQIRVIAEGYCSSDTCDFTLQVEMAQPPAIVCPNAIDTMLCLAETDTLLVPITITGTGVQVTVKPLGSYTAGQLKLPISEPGGHDFKIIAYSACGADTCDLAVDVTADQPPQLFLPDELTFQRCPDDEDQICISGFHAADEESDVTLTMTEGPDGAFTNVRPDTGVICFVPQTFGDIEFKFEATDGCHTVGGTYVVTIDQKEDCDVCVRFIIDGGEPTPVGLRKEVVIRAETNDEIPGFNLYLAYDASTLAFQSASMDGGVGEAWEYFTWNLDDEACGGACPSGIVRLVGMADRNNGAAHPPDSAYTPNGEFIYVEFQVANDQNLGDLFIPINFVWYNCGDNAVSDISGALLFVDSRIYNSEGVLIWDELDDVNFPEAARPAHVGAVDACVATGGKTEPVRCAEFYNGGIKVVDPDEIDDRGDINLNTLPYEIADAVMFTNYFIKGLQAFTINQIAQIAATDVNADGITLSVSDLTYLIRVIIGDAEAIPKTNPYTDRAFVYTGVQNDKLTVSTETAGDLGAAYLVYELPSGMTVGTPSTTTEASGFDLRYAVDGNRLKVLMYDIGRASVDAGRHDIIEIPVQGYGEPTLVHSELVDYGGRPYLSSSNASLPTDFDLMQNYPNPFNPTTTIRFALPQAAAWNLRVYNITGALVWETNGYNERGNVDVVWDGRSVNGQQAASGVYLYRLDSGPFNATRKMVLLK